MKNITNKIDTVTVPLEGYNLIEASAGTGKTHTITNLFLRLVIEKNMSIKEVLVVTFTEAATDELKVRIRKVLSEAKSYIESGIPNEELFVRVLAKLDKKEALRKINEAMINFDEASIYTIHGFCHKILRESAFSSGNLFDTELVTNQNNFIDAIVHDFWRSNLFNGSVLFTHYLMNHLKLDFFYRLMGNSPFVDLEIMPENHLKEDINIEKEYSSSLSEVKVMWGDSRAKVEEILLHSEALNRNKYREASILGWIAEMDHFVNFLSDFSFPFENIIKFSSNVILDSLKKGFDPPEHPFFVICERFISAHKKLVQVFDSKILEIKIRFLQYAKNELISRKEKQNLIFFDDLLLNVERALNDENWGENFADLIGSEYGAALIDEFQDTDNIQFRIFTKIFREKEKVLFLIGDPKQAIYGFRGADIFSYLAAAGHIEKSYTLTKNWRAQEELIKAINTIFTGIKNPFLIENIRYFEVESAQNPSLQKLQDFKKEYHPFTIWFSPTDETGRPITKTAAREIIAASVATEISRILNSAQSGQLLIGDSIVRPMDIAVLVRRNEDAVIIQSNLAKYNIASVLYDRGDIFKTKEALEIERILRAVDNPGNLKILKTALSTTILGITANEIFNFSNNTEALEIWISKFRNLSEIWSRSGFMKMFKTFLREEDILSRVILSEAGERTITNINHIGELLFIESLKNNPGRESLINWLSKKRLSERFSDEEQLLRLESDDDAVNIITMHKSKGLEFPVVFSPYLWDVRSNNSQNTFAKFHDPENGLKLSLDLGSKKFENHKKRQSYEDLAENIRLMYVSLTRAKNLCYFVWGRISGAELSAPAYLLHKNLLFKEGEEKVSLTSKIKDVKDSELLKELNELQAVSEGTIIVKNLPPGVGGYKRISRETGDNLKLKKINKIVEDDFKISSFSFLTSSYESFSSMREDNFTSSPVSTIKILDVQESLLNNDYSIFSFPGGTRAGTFFHTLLEQLDFSNRDSKYLKLYIEKYLAEFGYPSLWVDAIYKTIIKVQNITFDISPQKFRLNELKTENLRREMEFYFPISKINSVELQEFFYRNGLFSPNLDTSFDIEKLTFNSFSGFMRGFIDLVIEKEDQFFIVDWKSNFLGEGTEFYTKNHLLHNMVENNYYLQYFIYTAALHLYLKNRISNYSFDKNFGGVYYIYLRGLDDDPNGGNGIFRDKPAEEVVEQFCYEFVSKGKI